MRPLCLSIPLHPSLSHDEMDDDEHAWGTEGGRDGLYLLNTWWMWSLGLKGLGGQVAHWEQERACEWQRAPSSAPCCSLSQSLYPPPWRETQRIRQLTRQSKREVKTVFSVFYAAFLKIIHKSEQLEVKGKRQQEWSASFHPAHAKCFLSFSINEEETGCWTTWQTVRKERGDPTARVSDQTCYRLRRGVCRRVCGHESACSCGGYMCELGESSGNRIISFQGYTEKCWSLHLPFHVWRANKDGRWTEQTCRLFQVWLLSQRFLRQ